VSKKIFIAEPRDIIRSGLRSIFERNEQITEIYEASTCDAVRSMLLSYSFDLVVIHQALVTEFRRLPVSRFVLLTDKPDMQLLLEAYKYQVRGFLSPNVSAELLQAVLQTSDGTCILDPSFRPWMIDHVVDCLQQADEIKRLSPREREIFQLLQQGCDSTTIARRLHIAETTLKTHIKNITRKLEESSGLPNISLYQQKAAGSSVTRLQPVPQAIGSATHS
jgi:DNA-binding NarL/FixJ family response regulator